jgi:hypothetical protein
VSFFNNYFFNNKKLRTYV